MASTRTKGLVIVESPAKAKKINSYLGKDFTVLASMGHVRDLPSTATEIPEAVKKEAWSKLGVNVEANFEPLYIVPREKKKVVSELKAALKNADELFLATDEDREGESIGWHLIQILKPQVPVKRMVFSEITKEAIQDAIQHTRQLDENLVSAQETRRVLDRLFGYRLSPLLWKKVRPKLSAGRVQSLAVRLIVQRELERRAFRKGTFWDLKASLAKHSPPESAPFEAELATLGGRRIASGKDFDENTGRLKPGADVLLLDETAARHCQQQVQSSPWEVATIEDRIQTRRPAPPFTTSTLQQEASRKLSMSARETMQVAQRLYEEGIITYMRTDSVSLSQEAIKAARHCVSTRYGSDYLYSEVRQFTTKSKGAQEAHEAIRPAGTAMQTGEELGLSGRELRLYTLIWMRTVATQMAEARLRFQTVTIRAGEAEFRVTGRHIEFPGFFRAYVEGVDDPEAALDDQEKTLPPLTAGERLECREVQPLAHETQPPARFTEATLIRTLEANGVGRPSTYASIISTILDRGYVVKAGQQLRPTFVAMAVTKLLEQHFPQLVDEQFTAGMEQMLDDIATGEKQAGPYLREFYLGAAGLDEQVRSHEEQIDPRIACTLELEGLDAKVRVGKYGPYLIKEKDGESVTASLPEDIAPAEITNEYADELLQRKQEGPKSLGIEQHTGLHVYVLIGPFGPYIQLGQQGEDGTKPKRVSIPRGVDANSVTLEQALEFLTLPRTLGPHPASGKPVQAGIGRFGPYVVHEKTYKSLPKDQDVLKIELPAALELLAQARVRAGATPLKELGPHPADGETIGLFEGKYGHYVKHGKVNATIPKDRPFDEVTLAEAVALLEERGGKPAKASRSRKAPKKVAAKAAARKTASGASTKKAPRKKAAKRKPTKKSPPAE